MPASHKSTTVKSLPQGRTIYHDDPRRARRLPHITHKTDSRRELIRLLFEGDNRNIPSFGWNAYHDLLMAYNGLMDIRVEIDIPDPFFLHQVIELIERGEDAKVQAYILGEMKP